MRTSGIEGTQAQHVSEVCVRCGKAEGTLIKVEGYRGTYLLCPSCLESEDE
jgi:hypothetical protein